MTESTVLITGATGRSGRRVVRLLQARGLPIRPASRFGATRFDWHDPATWPAALDGCGIVYLCYSPDLALPGADGVIAGFTDAAIDRGVRRLVLLSGRGEEGAQRCERIVLSAAGESGVAATVVRCSWFQENFSEHFLRDAVLAGRIAVPAGGVTEPFVSLDDVAEVAVRALVGRACESVIEHRRTGRQQPGDAVARVFSPVVTGGGFDGQVLELTGPESIGFGRAADILSGALGREISYEAVDVEAFVGEAVGAGVDRVDAEGLAWLFQEVMDGRHSATTDVIQRVLGRPGTTFEEYARRAASAGAWPFAAVTAPR